MFDPGWRTQHRGWPANIPPEDQGTRDSGNDPEGMVSRCDVIVIRPCVSRRRFVGNSYPPAFSHKVKAHVLRPLRLPPRQRPLDRQICQRLVVRHDRHRVFFSALTGTCTTSMLSLVRPWILERMRLER